MEINGDKGRMCMAKMQNHQHLSSFILTSLLPCLQELMAIEGTLQVGRTTPSSSIDDANICNT